MYNFGLMLTSCHLGSRATAVELDSNHARNFFISKKRIVTIYFYEKMGIIFSDTGPINLTDSLDSDY